jgi:hypothetical protein
MRVTFELQTDFAQFGQMPYIDVCVLTNQTERMIVVLGTDQTMIG